MKPAASEEKSEGPRASSFPESGGLTTGSPSRAADTSPAELVRAALASLDGGVVRLGDLRDVLERVLAALEAAGEGPR